MSLAHVNGPEAPPWRYSTLHPPDHYRDRITRGICYWSGTPRHITTWLEAEWSCAACMRALGYLDAECTPPDTPVIDIRSRRAVGQVKREATAIKSKDVADFYEKSVDDHDKELWYFSGSGFTEPAVVYADLHSIMLFTYSITGELTPVNTVAQTRYTELMTLRAKRIARRDALRQQKILPYSTPPAPPVVVPGSLFIPGSVEWNALFALLFPDPGAASTGPQAPTVPVGAFPVLKEA